jgi:hypothetical protein
MDALPAARWLHPVMRRRLSGSSVAVASRGRSARAILVLALVVGVVLALAAINASSATAYIYWANFYGPTSIGRANLDGTGANQSFIPGRGDEPPIAALRADPW